jgi:hypothetical protein
VEAQKETLEVVLPDQTNRQFLLFWVAKGAGLFAAEGLDVRVQAATTPREAPDLFLREGECALLPPPLYYDLLRRRAPVVLVANLLAKEPANVVVRANLATELSTSSTAPLPERVGACAPRVCPGKTYSSKSCLANNKMMHSGAAGWMPSSLTHPFSSAL